MYAGSSSLSDSYPLPGNSSNVDDSSITGESSSLTDSSTFGSPDHDQRPEHLWIGSEVVTTSLHARSNLALAVAVPRKQGEFVIDQRIDAGVDATDMWPCLVISLPEERAFDRVESGIDKAVWELDDRLGEQPERAVVVCVAEDDGGRKVRGFAGPIDELDECSIEIV
jgi:hypothetical protein